MTPLPQAPDAFVRSGVTGRRGWILLDRGKALNALTLPMVQAIQAALDVFTADGRVEFVTIGSTRAGVFCAGGDIRAVRDASLAGRYADNRAFFTHEFALNRAIAEYPKPYVALIDGVCMGGGMGLSIHGRHRVVTEALTMAMPETAIGYFPDIGASWFLNQLPGAIGTYLALTGARVQATDADYSGLATACTSAEGLVQLSERLDTVGAGGLDEAIRAVAIVPAGASHLREHRAAIDRCFTTDDMPAIFAALEAECTDWGRGTLATMHGLSPTSLCTTLALLRRTRDLPLPDCLAIELRLTERMTRGRDFLEGVRAVLVDKDRQPRWQPCDWSRVDG